MDSGLLDKTIDVLIELVECGPSFRNDFVLFLSNWRHFKYDSEYIASYFDNLASYPKVKGSVLIIDQLLGFLRELYMDSRRAESSFHFLTFVLHLITNLISESLENRLQFDSNALIDLLTEQLLSMDDETMLYDTTTELLFCLAKSGLSADHFDSVLKSSSYEILTRLFKDNGLAIPSVVLNSSYCLQFNDLTLQDPKNGFTLSCWMKFKSNRQIAYESEENYLFFELLDNNRGTIVSFNMHNGKLQFECHEYKDSFELFTFQLDTMYNITIAYETHKSKNGKFTLYVNSENIQSKMTDVIFKEPCVRSSLFSSFKGHANPQRQKFHLVIHGPPVKSNTLIEVTNVVLLNDSKPAQAITSLIYHLGPCYAGNFLHHNIISLLTSRNLIKFSKDCSTISAKGEIRSPVSLDFEKSQITLMFSVMSKKKHSNRIRYIFWTPEKGLAEGFHTLDGYLCPVNIPLIETLDCIGGTDILLEKITNASSANYLHALLQVLFFYLKEDKNSQKVFAANLHYNILATVLKQKKNILSLKTLDIILEYVGYNHFEPAESLICDTLAYKTLVFDFDIWDCQNDKEILKFLLFQFTVFVQNSKYNKFNLRLITEMGIIRKIVLFLKDGLFNIEILPLVQDLLLIILKNHLTAPLIKSLEKYTIFSIQKNYEGDDSSYKKEIQTVSGEMVMEVLVLLFNDFLNTNNGNEQKLDIYKLVNQKWLVACLCGSSKMKFLTIKLIAVLIRCPAFPSCKVLSGESLGLSSYLLKDNWNDEQLKILLFASSFSNCSLAHTTGTLLEFAIDTQNIKNVTLKSTEFLLVLNNLMKNAALNLRIKKTDPGVFAVLEHYIKFLNKVRLINNELNCYFFTNIIWFKGILSIVSILKEENSSILFKEYNALIKEIVAVKLYTSGDNDNNYIERLNKECLKEFNFLIIPIITTILTEADSPFFQLANYSKREACVIKVFYKYLKSTIDHNSKSEINIIGQIGAIIDKIMQQDSKFELKKNVPVFLESFCLAYLSTLMISTSTSLSVESKYCLEVFMAFSEILLQYQTTESKAMIFTCFVKMLTTQNCDSQSVIINCMRVFILKWPETAKLLEFLECNEDGITKLSEILTDFAHWNDDQVIEAFNLDENIRDVFDKSFDRVLKNSGAKKKGLEALTSCIEPQHEKQMKLKIDKEIQPFINAVFNAELKGFNKYLQDNLDDVKIIIEAFDTLTRNLPCYSQTKLYTLDLTEGKYRMRNKFIKVQNTQDFQFFNLINKSSLKNIKEDADINDSFLVWFKEDADDDFDFKEDKNRSVSRNLIAHDQINEIYNVVQIVGLDTIESILIVGTNHLYLVGGYFCTKSGDIIELINAPETERDTFVSLLKDVTNTNDELDLSTSIGKRKTWPFDQLLSVSKRQFLLRDTAFEMFFKGGESILLTCNTGNKRNDIYNKLTSKIVIKLEDINLKEALDIASQQKIRSFEKSDEGFTGMKLMDALLTNLTDISLSDLTDRWCHGQVSNFYYLMLVNTIAGRTFNDLTQYPVFPFILKDYESKILDLKDVSIYRDLKKPMGAQYRERELAFQERYDAASEMGDLHPFHYGTHYSSAMIVASYLIRIMPFTDFYLNLQGGKFDHADRLFNDVSKLWKSASCISTDVRELIPEFYYLPDFLLNTNGYNFGETQDGIKVDDVDLPPWANNDPVKFVQIMREALESDFVSENLNHWIDLIFGYRQQGEEAINATNVFHNYSYPGNIDLNSITDKHERSVVTSIIHNFGQTPLQIFHKPHPPKKIGYKSVLACLDNFKNEQSNIHCIFPVIDEILYDQYQKKWIPLPWNLKILRRSDLSDMRVVINEPNNISINGKYQFEHLMYSGYVTSCCIIANGKFLLGFSNGIIKLFIMNFNILSNVTNAYKETIIYENKIANVLGSSKSKSNFKSGTTEDRSVVLTEDLTMRCGKSEPIIKLKYWNTEGVVLSMSSSRDCITLWDISNKQAIHEMRRIKIEGVIRDFSINFEDSHIYVINNSGQLTVWTINGVKVSMVKIGKDALSCVACLKNLDNRYKRDFGIVAVGFSDGSIEIYNNYGRDLLRELNTGIKNLSAMSMVFVGEKLKVAVGGESGCFSID